MFDNLKKILEKIDADYADIRYEEKIDTNISFNGKNIAGIGSNSADGYVLRVLKNGGFASMAFTNFENADNAVQKVLEDAAVIAKNKIGRAHV